MLMTATEFLNIFDVDDYAESEAGAELECTPKDCNKYNIVYTSYEYLELPEVDVTEIAALDYQALCTYDDVISYLTDYYNDTCDTCDNEYVSVYMYDNNQVMLSDVDHEAAECLESKSYEFVNDDTLAYGFIEAYNKRCECSFTIKKPQACYGKSHNYQLYVIGANFIDASLADYGSKYYHFNVTQVSKLVDEVNELRRQYCDEE